MLITFIYKFLNNTKYFGKFVGDLSYLMYTNKSTIDINNINTTNLIKIELVQIIMKEYLITNISLDDIFLGIIAINETYDQYCIDEKNIFDVLIIYNDFEKLIYFENKLIENLELTDTEVSSDNESDNNDIINQIIELD